MLKEEERAAVRQIKESVKAMLDERSALRRNRDGITIPSDYWLKCCETFDYMLNLHEDSYAKLRLHTYHLTFDHYQVYLFGDGNLFRKESKIDELTEELPPEFVINEPQGGIGFSYSDGRFLSGDVIRYQKIIHSLHSQGVFSLFSKTERNFVLEIGGGYGGLAYHLSKLLPNTTYVMIDLPETLLFSAAYLSLLYPNKKRYVYNPTDFEEALMHPERYDFIFLPNYRLDALLNLRFKLVLNVASFQEMTSSQVNDYLDFVVKTCTGVLYSSNQEANALNQELSKLTPLLSERFHLFPIENKKVNDGFFLKVAKKLKGVLTRGRGQRHSPPTTHEYLCKVKQK